MRLRLLITVVVWVVSTAAPMASTPTAMHLVTPENINDHDLEFKIKVEDREGFVWFEISIKPEKLKISPNCSAVICIDSERNALVELNSTVFLQLKRRMSGKVTSYRFGVNDRMLEDSYFSFRNIYANQSSTRNHGYRVKLLDFVK